MKYLNKEYQRIFKNAKDLTVFGGILRLGIRAFEDVQRKICRISPDLLIGPADYVEQCFALPFRKVF